MGRARDAALWGPVLGYASIVFVLSGLSSPPEFGPDTSAHALEYAGLGLLIARALGGGLAGVDGRAAGLAWLIATAYGASDELHQSFVPNRVTSLKDWIMDGVGAAVGVSVAWRFANRRTEGEEAE